MTDHSSLQKEKNNTDIVERLSEDAADHVEVAKCCDCRPEDTVNWRHAENAKERLDEITRLRAEAEALRKALRDLIVLESDGHHASENSIEAWERAHAALDATKGTT